MPPAEAYGGLPARSTGAYRPVLAENSPPDYFPGARTTENSPPDCFPGARTPLQIFLKSRGFPGTHRRYCPKGKLKRNRARFPRTRLAAPRWHPQDARGLVAPARRRSGATAIRKICKEGIFALVDRLPGAKMPPFPPYMPPGTIEHQRGSAPPIPPRKLAWGGLNSYHDYNICGRKAQGRRGSREQGSGSRGNVFGVRSPEFGV